MENRRELLVKALLDVQTKQQCNAVIDDLLTPKEIEDLSNRLYVAQLLDQGKTFADIEGLVRTSSTTISRVNRCLKSGNGYRFILEQMKKEERCE